jgi:TolA-binding protein
MELTHTYNSNKATSKPHQPALRQSLTAFLNKNTNVFEALTRGGAPFGGNWLPIQVRVTRAKTTKATSDSVAQLQQQLDELIHKVSTLSDQINGLQQATKAPIEMNRKQANEPVQPVTRPKQIGINRFRALKAQS